MRLFPSFLVRFFLIISIPTFSACGQTGIVTGGDLTYCGSFTEEQSGIIDLALLLYVCPKIEDKLDGRPCTVNLIGHILREAHIFFYEGEKDYCVDYRP